MNIHPQINIKNQLNLEAKENSKIFISTWQQSSEKSHDIFVCLIIQLKSI